MGYMMWCLIMVSTVLVLIREGLRIFDRENPPDCLLWTGLVLFVIIEGVLHWDTLVGNCVGLGFLLGYVIIITRIKDGAH